MTDFRFGSLSVVLIVGLSFLESNAIAQDKRAELWFYAHCDKTTEKGEDELFLRMTIDGAKPSRMPEQGHWNINDNGTKRKVVKKIFDKVLKPNEEVKIVLVVMEEDGDLPGFIDALSKAGQAYAKDKESKSASLIPILAEIVKPIAKNSDDRIGSFAINLKNVGGTIQLKVGPAQKEVNQEKNAEDEHDKREIPNFRARGDGSNYHIGFWLGGPRKSMPEQGELGK